MAEFTDAADAVIRSTIAPDTHTGGTLDDTPGLPWSDAARAAAVRLVEAQFATLVGDLAAFARHAKRSTINVEDVRLALRRTPALAERVSRRVSEDAALRKRAPKPAEDAA